MTTRLQDIKQRISNTLDTIDGMVGNQEGEGETTFLDQILARLSEAGVFPKTSSDSSLMQQEGNVINADTGSISGAEKPIIKNANRQGEVEVDPLEQIRADIAMLRKQIGMVDQLQAQIAVLPGKDEIVASVLSRIPAPKCSCQKESGAAAEARDPDCLAGIGPC